MELRNLWISAAVRCAPPDNKPLPSELANCAEYTARELAALKSLKVVVALGKIAFDAYLDTLLRQSVIARKTGYRFAHAAEYPMPNGLTLLASYHPSNQNTATGKLTTPMFEAVFLRARELAME
jgi:uracil-DNA glycosylase family 4